MADSWEDEDFQVPQFKAPVVSTNSAAWDDEEEAVAADPALPVAPTPAQIEAQRKRQEEEAIKAQNKAKFAAMANESAEDRKARERKAVEDADAELSKELFGKAAVSTPSAAKPVSISSVSGSNATLKTIGDHRNYAITVANKFTASASTPFNVGAFYSKLTNELKKTLPVESLQEAIEALTNELEAKKATTKKPVVQKKSKKEVQQEKKHHEDVFGGDFVDDKYSHYSNIEDDFM
jgi:hypothetical protein